MGKGKNKESIAQEKKNLLGINPIADHASGSFMSKHSITSNGSTSPLHDKGEHKHPHSTVESVKSFGRKTVKGVKDFVNDPRWEGAGKQFSASVNRAVKGNDPTSKAAKAIYGSDIQKSKDYFNKK